MQPLVQSAIDAANQGDNQKALELCKQALTAAPNDIDAWLVLAAVIEQPERKRQCLNRVLTLDPTNQIARDELLEMDRAAMGGAPVPAPNYPTSPPAFQSEPAAPSSYQYSPAPDYLTSASTFEAAPAPPVPAPVTP